MWAALPPPRRPMSPSPSSHLANREASYEIEIASRAIRANGAARPCFQLDRAFGSRCRALSAFHYKTLMFPPARAYPEDVASRYISV